MIDNDEQHDNDILKELNQKLKQVGIKLKFWYYDGSPFTKEDKRVIPIILSHIERLYKDKNKIFLLSVLGVRGYDEAVPALVNEYKFYCDNIYSEPCDELQLLYLCNTIAKISSKKYIDLYIELLQMPATTALESIIKKLSKMKISRVDEFVFNLIEKENKIPEVWRGTLNERDKYWCSLNALKYMVDKKDSKYRCYIQKFLQPEELKWIQFSESKYMKANYTSCYKEYIGLAKKGLFYLR